VLQAALKAPWAAEGTFLQCSLCPASARRRIDILSLAWSERIDVRAASFGQEGSGRALRGPKRIRGAQWTQQGPQCCRGITASCEWPASHLRPLYTAENSGRNHRLAGGPEPICTPIVRLETGHGAPLRVASVSPQLGGTKLQTGRSRVRFPMR
jgi:hypothetical protein